jgi:GH24 family phage-related lysozyme (muramidase)
MSMRLPVAVLSLSAAAFVGLVVSEGYAPSAVIPTKGDVPTVGFGSTVHADGTKVKMGDQTTPVEALQTASAHLKKDEMAFKASLPGAFLTQAEYDLYLDFVYQYGMSAWLKSSMRRELLAHKPEAACEALLKYKFQAGRDCSLPQNWGPQGCKGVWTRQQARHRECLAAVAGLNRPPAGGSDA